MEEQKQQPEEQKLPLAVKVEEKDTTIKRMGRGFRVMYQKFREWCTKMNENQIEQAKQKKKSSGNNMFEISTECTI